jgi:dTDP-4-amino-4,6-dideoxygalactose transaminase
MGQTFGGYPGQCPVTEMASDCLLRLPFFNDLTEDEQGYVISGIQEFQVLPESRPGSMSHE